MSAASYDLTVEQGATFVLVVAWQDPAGVPIVLTGWTARAQVRESPGAAGNPLVTFTATVAGVAGTVTLSLTAAQTAALTFDGTARWDLEVASPGGEVHRLLTGRVTLVKRVTV